MTTRGERNNNPGNIVWTGSPIFPGEIGPEPGPGTFAVFDTAENGIRAIASNLLAYQDRHGLNTVDGIIRRWSQTDQDIYVANVCAAVGVGPDTPLDLHSPSVMVPLVAAIIRQENGEQPYPVESILHPQTVQELPTGASIRPDLPTPIQLPAEADMPVFAALLPSILGMIPSLISVFGKGPQAQVNAKAAEIVTNALTQATGGANLQAAVEAMQADPTVKDKAAAAVVADPLVAALMEVGGGVDAARKANLAFMQAQGDVWWLIILKTVFNPVLIISFALLPLVYLFVNGLVPLLVKVSPDVISQTMGTVIGLVLGGICGFWLGMTYMQHKPEQSQ